MLWPRPKWVTLDALARLVRMENLGALPQVLAPTAGWQPHDQDHAADGRVPAECARLHWLDRRGQLDIDVASALTVLCRASVEYYGWITTGADTIGVLAGAIGREALLAVGRDGWVSVRSIRPEDLAMMLVAQAPDVPAGQGKPVRVRRPDALAFDDGRRRSHGGVAVQPVSIEVRRLMRTAALPRTGGGELHVAVRDSVGRRVSGKDPIGYVDTTAGRYVTVTDTVGGEAELMIAPAGQRDLMRRLNEAHRALTGQ